MSARGFQAIERQAGVAALEFALVLIPLLIVLTGITEFGRAMYYYNTMAKSARDAVRLLSTQTPSDPDYATLLARATCTAVYGNQTCAGSPLVPGLATAMVSVCDPQNCAATHALQGASPVINLVTVTVGGGNTPYVFQPLVPLLSVQSIPFGPISATMRQIL